MSLDHPSIITNKNSLNGSEIVSGLTIIIPMASKMFETIRSMAMC
jgi:hypothetical protein